MSKHFWIASLIMLGLMLAIPASAQGRGRDKDHDRDDRKELRDHDADHDRDKSPHHVGHNAGHDRDFDRDGDRDDHDRRPPGWSHGRKTGWGDCDVPPGQAKKHGCHSGHRHPSTRTVNHTPVLRRPRAEVHAHGSVDAGVH
ncbi:MAG: hypothetical protein DMG74_15060 [Acidobacteria bacterium]|nr:MAG: hypothetical protein DMG74_15060 [Acidobacteriota bacterium]